MDQSSEQSADRSWLTYPELAAALGIDKPSAIRLALLLVALPFVAHAQSLPDWPIDQLCQDDQTCISRNVSARNFLRDKTWQQAGAQKRAECLKWEASLSFYRRYRPELPAAERYMNLYMCTDGAIDPKCGPRRHHFRCREVRRSTGCRPAEGLDPRLTPVLPDR